MIKTTIFVNLQTKLNRQMAIKAKAIDPEFFLLRNNNCSVHRRNKFVGCTYLIKSFFPLQYFFHPFNLVIAAH